MTKDMRGETNGRPTILKMEPSAMSFEPHACDCDLGECRTNVLPFMNEMSRIAHGGEDLSETLCVLLELLKTHMNVVRAMVSLFEPGSGNIFIHDSFGLSVEERAKGVYFLGEGVTGRVVETGEAIVVPQIGDEPSFLDRTQSRSASDRRLSFLCVPIMRSKKVLGTISAERIYDNSRLLKLDVEVLSILATMTAQAVELYLVENIEKVALENENRRLRSVIKSRFKPSNIIGNSKPMQDVYKLIEKVTRTKTTVLILGESGVGKELVASAIHFNSNVAKGPFVKFNCAALPESVIESELFGHEKGSFTGAIGARKGRFEEAHGGTIFLDEVGELSLAVQAKLLRVLQEKTFERVGGNAQIKVDIRILAATNRDLLKMVEKGTFREDLYYRLNVFPVTIPPLRERGNDVIALADYFVAQFSHELGVRSETHLDLRDQYAFELSLARQCSRTRKRHRAGDYPVRRWRDPRLQPAAVASDADFGGSGMQGQSRIPPQRGRMRNDCRGPESSSWQYNRSGQNARADAADSWSSPKQIQSRS